MKKLLLSMAVVFLVLFPSKSFSQDRTQFEMIVSIEAMLGNVSSSIVSLTSDLREVKRSVDILTNKVGIIENDYSSFKTNDWPNSLNKLNTVDTTVTVLNTDYYNLKNITIPNIRTDLDKHLAKFEQLEKKTINTDNENSKQNGTYSVIIAIGGVICTAFLSVFLNRKYNKKDDA